MDSGDTAWMLTSTALVLFMVPGLALFYGGMVRGKNMLEMLMKVMVCTGIVTIVWVLVGASLAFGGNTTIGDWSIIGNFSLWGLQDLGLENDFFGEGYPDTVHMAFQAMFAIITCGLIAGAVAERMKFSAWAIFVPIWALLVYVPMAHWVWGGGFIDEQIGAVDFAGGLVVHINSGAAALALALVLGPRLGWRREVMRPNSLPLTMLGAGMLWFGWFGFNAGSALASDGAAGMALLVTQVAAGTAVVFWAIAETLRNGKPTALGLATAAIAGLVAITPAAGFVGPLGAIVIGAAAGLICYWALQLKFALNFDDSLDVVAVHMIGGIVGALLIGLVAVEAIGGVAASMEQFGRQALSVVVALVYSFGLSFALAKILDVTMGLRVPEAEERGGLDLALHDEQAYDFTVGSSVPSGGTSGNPAQREQPLAVTE